MLEVMVLSYCSQHGISLTPAKAAGRAGAKSARK
jgi:hypothetical protein